jgi:hypothetical protein
MTIRYKGAPPWLLVAMVAAFALVALALWGVARLIRADLDKPGGATPSRKSDKYGK